ncbi:glycosyltransferase family 61 protein [Saprospiraceae bacterium]|nr:glycosyltransferase family 61 protein [Saprospiraceae bacterium]
MNNYCHWNFSELPYLFLAFESQAKHLVFPDSIVDVQLSFQKRWLELLISLYPDKVIHRISKKKFPKNSLIPINHDTSTNTNPIGACQYKHFHHSRATPYLINIIEEKYKKYFNNAIQQTIAERIYIRRKNRVLKNELELQNMVKELDFKIVELEKMDLDEQVLLFYKAKTIIGFHVAGLSNILFLDKSVQVFEIVDSDCVYPCYIDGVVIPGQKATRTYFHMLSEMKGIDYHAIESDEYYLNVKYFKNKLITTLYKRH